MCSTKSQRCVTGIGHFFWAENCGFLGQLFRNEWQSQLVSENTMVSLEKRAALSFLVSFLWEKVLFLKLAVQTLLLTHTLQKLFRDFTAWLSPCPFLLFPPVSFLQPQKYLLFCFRAPPLILADLGKWHCCHFFLEREAVWVPTFGHGLVCVHRLCLPSQQSHCYMIRNGKEVILTLDHRDKENDCIYHIFTSVASFLGLS